MKNSNDKKQLNFELDLLPFISMLSCCICFLMITAIWTNLGSLDVKQGLGQESDKAASEDKSSLWVMVNQDGSVELSVKDAPTMPASFGKISIHSRGNGKVDFLQVDRVTAQINKRLPDLKIALVMPKAQVAYGDVITVMDRLKKNNISEVGIAPL